MRAGGRVQLDAPAEGVVLDDYPGDERFDELGEVLALYAPGQGVPYSGSDEVRAVISKTIASIE